MRLGNGVSGTLEAATRYDPASGMAQVRVGTFSPVSPSRP